MDRTSWLAVIVCVGLLIGWTWWNGKNVAKRAAELDRRAAEEAAANPTPADGGAAASDIAVPTIPATAGTPQAQAPKVPVADETTVKIANDLVAYEFTNVGAGIKRADLLEYADELGDTEEFVTINEESSYPVGAFSRGPGDFDQTAWAVKEQTDTSVTFSTVTDGLAIEKKFSLGEEGQGRPYEVRLDVTLRNEGTTEIATGRRYLYAGSAGPLHFNEWPMQIGYFTKEKDGKFGYEDVNHFGGGKGFLGMGGGEKGPSDDVVEGLDWAGVNNQFFATVIKANENYGDCWVWAHNFDITVDGDEVLSKKKATRAVEAAMGLPNIPMKAGDQHTLKYEIYTGPKEFSLLKPYDDKRTEVMHYDQIPIFGWMFGWIIKPLAGWLIQGLVFVKGLVGTWGLAIIIVTILIRLIIWPVYAKSTRTMKRMSKLTPKMTELKEKHKDNPQKMNEETMKLYRKYGVNPLGGCLPMFIQMPVFLAFYRMLWSAVEMRHESFLWVEDLAMPDTLFQIPGLNIPFNLLPILMAITTFVQMAMTPKTGDKTQRMIFMMMPFIFLVICYNFAAALALYWTTSNLFTIFQTWIMNKLPEPELKPKAQKPGKPGKKSFMERMQDAQEAQNAKKNGGGGGAAKMGPDKGKISGDKGERHQKSKKNRKKR